MLNKPFVLVQEFCKSAWEEGSYGGLNIFKIAVMNAAIL